MSDPKHIKKTLFISTDHVCQSTHDMLEAESLRDSGGISSAAPYPSQLGGTVGRYGNFAWFMWVPDKKTDSLRDPPPADLAMIFEYARQLGCEYLVIKVDTDAQANPDLPVYPKE